MIDKVKKIVDRVSLNLMGIDFKIKVSLDEIYEDRVYLQVIYESPCTETGIMTEWKGGKYYLSEFMTSDEIIKKCYVAFEQAVKHEVMEGFKVDNIVLFNPHVDFEQLLKISKYEIRRN